MLGESEIMVSGIFSRVTFLSVWSVISIADGVVVNGGVVVARCVVVVGGVGGAVVVVGIDVVGGAVVSVGVVVKGRSVVKVGSSEDDTEVCEVIRIAAAPK